MKHTERKAHLEALLLGFQHLWRPQPFKIETPDWCTDHPVLTAKLLDLDDDAVERLGADNTALIEFVSGHVPALTGLAQLVDLAPLAGPGPTSLQASREGAPLSSRFHVDIPGRKQAQIEAYAVVLGEPTAPVLEWCAGKGHLGRLLAARWQRPVASLEIDTALCEAGTRLAHRAGLEAVQHFIPVDVLTPDSSRHLTGRHAVALHACGDLHTRLVAEAAANAVPALDVAPCCYYRTAKQTYRPFNASDLQLGQDDLRLAVTETATASASQRRQSRRALAWKLGWVELRKQLTGETDYRSFPPVPEAWLRGDFANFVELMCQRESPLSGTFSRSAEPLSGETARSKQCRPGVRIDPHLADHFEALGHARAARMLRLQLVRLAFRRPLEVWLLMDMATFLERHGYRVAVGPFCDAALTPRNLMLSARH